MPHGKAAGERCVQLTPENRCAIFGHPERPQVCSNLRALVEMCGPDTAHAMTYLRDVELATMPLISTRHD